MRRLEEIIKTAEESGMMTLEDLIDSTKAISFERLVKSIEYIPSNICVYTIIFH